MYKNKISIIGSGYVGLVTGVCLADFGNTIINADVDEKKIQSLRDGKVPIYEPGLEDMLGENLAGGRITFTADIPSSVRESEVIFIAVGTPDKDGRADLSHVRDVARTVGANMNGYKVIVTKSTVPLGTGSEVEGIIKAQLNRREADYCFDVVSNPEFLREGNAVYDFTHPDRIIIGTGSEKARGILRQVYKALYLNDSPFVFCSRETAELIKYASNAFLATKISFINELALLCEKAGANIQLVSRAMGMDGRIGAKFLHAGPGYGGSCFPKDTRAIVSTAEELDVELKVIKASIRANQYQKEQMVKKITSRLGDITGKTLGVLGLSFKPDTDDMRESPSLAILPQLIESGALIRAYDPQSMAEAEKYLSQYRSSISYCSDPYEAMEGSDALILITEWNQFRRLDLEKVKRLMAEPIFFDLRNVYDKGECSEAGIEHIGVGVS